MRQSEFNKYQSHIKDVEIIPAPDEQVNNIAKKRNWILANKTTDYVLMVDDDMSSLNWILNRKLVKLEPDNIDHIIRNGFQMAEDAGCGMWGINMVPDPKAYRIFNPFSFGLPILGPFCGVLDCSIRYDENLFLKEDYDFALQQLRKHRRILRINFLNYIVDHEKLDGGCQDYRTPDLERKHMDDFINKWGSDIAGENWRHEESINPSINLKL